MATSTARSLLPGWSRRDWRETGLLLGVIAAMHVVGFGALIATVGRHSYSLGTTTFGVGLGITAYTLGMRHAFDADHIAAIDNTTRKLMAEGRRPKSVGFWFALGHSTTVFGLAVLVAAGARAVGTLTSEGSTTHQVLGLVSTLSSGGFLYLIGIANLLALSGIVRVFTRLRRGELDERQLEQHLAPHGFVVRVLRPLLRAINRPGQMFPVGMVLGLGFDTATEVTLLVLAGTGALAGVPWYVILLLPLLFASGMSLLDTLDGLFMHVAYDWAFARPVRRIYYNLVITGLSAAVAMLIGSIELIGVLHDKAGLADPVTGWISRISLNNVGFVVVGLFLAVWIAAVTFWRLGRVEQRWTQPVAQEDGEEDASHLLAAQTSAGGTATRSERDRQGRHRDQGADDADDKGADRQAGRSVI
jgi:nickel/cobalt transporter (NiCoT) family protein